MDMAEEEWGAARMLAAVKRTEHATAGQVLHGVFQAADEFTGEAPQHDVMTLVIVRALTT